MLVRPAFRLSETERDLPRSLALNRSAYRRVSPCLLSPKRVSRFLGVNAAALVAFLDMFGLALLCVRVTRFVSGRNDAKG
jgi:hypothetical protein